MIDSSERRGKINETYLKTKLIMKRFSRDHWIGAAGKERYQMNTRRATLHYSVFHSISHITLLESCQRSPMICAHSNITAIINSLTNLDSSHKMQSAKMHPQGQVFRRYPLCPL